MSLVRILIHRCYLFLLFLWFAIEAGKRHGNLENEQKHLVKCLRKERAWGSDAYFVCAIGEASPFTGLTFVAYIPSVLKTDGFYAPVYKKGVFLEPDAFLNMESPLPLCLLSERQVKFYLWRRNLIMSRIN